MPVTSGVFEARTALTVAESAVAWTRVNSHVILQRQKLEADTAQLARRVGYLIGSQIQPVVQLRELEEKLAAGLRKTYAFGYDEAQRELADLRARNGGSDGISGAEQPDLGDPAVKQRFDRLASDARQAVEQAAREADGPVFASTAAVKQLHLSAMEAVGLALNLGRTAGAMTAPGGPPVYSMRSEQLDRGTCPECQRLHGEIVEVGSDQFYELMPPSHCYGGGRCRGIMVYGDTQSALS